MQTTLINTGVIHNIRRRPFKRRISMTQPRLNRMPKKHRSAAIN